MDIVFDSQHRSYYLDYDRNFQGNIYNQLTKYYCQKQLKRLDKLPKAKALRKPVKNLIHSIINIRTSTFVLSTRRADKTNWTKH